MALHSRIEDFDMKVAHNIGCGTPGKTSMRLADASTRHMIVCVVDWIVVDRPAKDGVTSSARKPVYTASKAPHSKNFDQRRALNVFSSTEIWQEVSECS
jgi:hypothetical protein